MNIQENYSLKKLNSFGIDVIAKQYVEITSVEELVACLKRSDMHRTHMILGGGSNVLFTQKFEGLVIKNNLKGIELVKEDNDFVYVKAAAGENWHNFVLHCIQNGWGGIENLSLIPGNVGASPMQNIGAYGVEIKDVFYSLEAVNLKSLESRIFTATDCKFGYRESVFKKELKGQYFICSVTYKLRKKPIFNTSYGAIEQELKKMGVSELSLDAVSKAICTIRSSKLPDPAKIGNAGSFFKNPVVKDAKFENLRKEYPNIIGFPNGENYTKLAAGWLIENCGWRGYRKGDAGVHKDQALVLVNYGNASGKEIFNLSTQIKNFVESKFGVELEREVNIY